MSNILEDLGATEEDLLAFEKSENIEPTPTAPKDPSTSLSFSENDLKEFEEAEGIQPQGYRTMDSLAPEEQEVLMQTFDQEQSFARNVFSPEEYEQIKAKGSIGFLEARKFLDYEDVLPGGGAVKAVETYQLHSAVKKLEKGEELSISEEDILRQFTRETAEKQIRGFSLGGGVAYGFAQLPAFVTEFAVTAGVGKAAQEGAEAAVGKLIKNRVMKSTTGAIANVGARSAVLPTQYVPTYMERRVNDFMAVTDKGEVLLKESEESPAVSLVKAYGYTAADVGAELVGGAIGKHIVTPIASKGARYLRTPISSGVQQLPAGIRHGLYTAYKGIQPNATVSKVFSRAGLHSMVAELGEERVAEIMKASLDLSLDDDMTFEDYMDAITPDKEQLLTEAGIFSLVSGVRGSANLTYNILTKDQGMSPSEAKQTIENLSETELENFNEENLSVRSPQEPKEVSLTGTSYDEAKQKEQPIPINHEESTFQATYRDYVDDLDALREVKEQLQEDGVTITAANDFESQARISRGVLSTIEHNVRYGTTRFNRETGTQEVTGKSLQDILSDFDAITSLVETDKDNRRYDSNLYGQSVSILDDVELAKTDDSINISPEQEAQARQDLADLEAKYGDEFVFLQENAKEKTEYAQRVALNLVDSGLMSQEAYDKMVKDRPNYLPLQRIFDDNPGLAQVYQDKAFSEVDSGVRKRRGSDREIQDIDKSLLINTARIMDAAARNRVVANLTGFAEFLPDKVQKVSPPMKKITVKDPDGGADIVTYRPTGEAPKGAVTAYVNGKAQYFKVSKPLLKALEGMDPPTMGMISKASAGITSIIKATATTFNLDFLFRAPIRDVVGASVTSRGEANLVTFAKGIYDIVTQNQNFKDFKADGGSFDSFMALDDKGFEKGLKDLLGDTKFDAKSLSTYPGFKQISDLNTLFEMAPRVGVYGKLRKRGEPGLIAATYARDVTLDFSRYGHKGRELNKHFAFLNAGIQGTDKLRRAFQEAPLETSMHAVAKVTMPSVALAGYYLFLAPEEEREAYRQIPPYIKDGYWVFRVDGEWQKIPKPWSTGYVFGAVPEKILTAIHDNINGAPESLENKELSQQIRDTIVGILSSVSPVPISTGEDPVTSGLGIVSPSAIKPIIEIVANQDFYRQQDIIPDWLEDDVDGNLQKKSYTSKSLVALMDKAEEKFGSSLSPAQLEHVIQAYTVSLGRLGLDTADMVFTVSQELAGEDVPASPTTIRDYPVFRAFSVNAPIGSSAQSVMEYKDIYDDLEQTYNSHRKYISEEKFEEADAYEQRHLDDLYLYEDLTETAEEDLKGIYEEINRIYDDPDMTSEEKVEALAEQDTQMLDVAKRAHKLIKQSKENRDGK